jgi:hypothetical protein
MTTASLIIIAVVLGVALCLTVLYSCLALSARISRLEERGDTPWNWKEELRKTQRTER